MEITLEKILELKEAAKELGKAAREAEIAFKTKPSAQIRLRSMVTVRPIDRIGGESIPDGYVKAQRDYASTTWLAIFNMAKSIHAPILFYETERKEYGFRRSYFAKHSMPVKLCELTEDQLELSASLASELAEVYNKYFALANPTAKVRYCGNTEFTDIPVKTVG